MTGLLSDEEIVAWGWRIPFLVGGIFGSVLWVLRKGLQESSEYQETQEIGTQGRSRTEKYWGILKGAKIDIVSGMLITLFSSSLVVVHLQFPFWINHTYGTETKIVYQAITVSLVMAMFLTPITGWIGDRLGHVNLARFISFAYIVAAIFIYDLPKGGGYYRTMIFVCVHQSFICIYASSYFPIIHNLFPTSIRFTCVALCYNTVYAIMGVLPFMVTYFQTHSPGEEVMKKTLCVTSAVAHIGLWVVHWRPKWDSMRCPVSQHAQSV
eukprot:GHVN01033433.1.p1 GENE.GHVN01033433.1~~GHVN01033433.1.p1  ORF type:complete len:304 (+),score=5.35 GHVN01033433.1:113-913(+)